MSRIRNIRILGLEHVIGEDNAYGMARGMTSRRGGGVVYLETDDGAVGIGEAWGPTGVAAAYLALVKPYFVGTSVFAQRGVQRRILAQHYHLGTQNQMIALFSGIDIAAHDAMGKLLNRPVYDLIGGRQREAVAVYGSGGYFTREADQEAALARQLSAVADRGFGAYKIKIGRHPAEDAARVRIAREILGPQAVLMVDSNGNYTVDQALRSMQAVAPYGIGWYEEPLAPQDWKGYAELKARASVPVASGEALYEVFDFKRLIDARLADVVQPDLSLCGGLSVARVVGEWCAAEHLRISPHVWGTAIGLAAAVHWVASLTDYPHTDHPPDATWVEYDVGENLLRDGLLTSPLTPHLGMLTVPALPGLGVELDPGIVERCTVR